MSTENQFNTNSEKPMKVVSESFAIVKKIPIKKNAKEELLTKAEKQKIQIAASTIHNNIMFKMGNEGKNTSKSYPVFERLKNMMGNQTSGFTPSKFNSNSLSSILAQNAFNSTNQLNIKELTSSNKLNAFSNLKKALADAEQNNTAVKINKLLKGWPSKAPLFGSMSTHEIAFPSNKIASSKATINSPFPYVERGGLSKKHPSGNNPINFKSNTIDLVNSDVYVSQTPVKPLGDDQIDLIMQLVTKAISENLQNATKPFLTKMELLKDELKEALNTRIQDLEANLNPQATKDEEFMNACEVMELLKISNSTFYRHHKKWKCIKVGAKSFYYKSEILQQLRYHAK